MKMLRSVIGAVIFGVVLIGVSPAGAATDDGATQTIRDVTGKMLTGLEKCESIGDIRDLVEHTALPLFDFDRMSKFMLGEAWEKAAPEQRQAFRLEFRKLLSSAYAEMVSTYKGEKIDFLPTKLDPDVLGRAVVSMRVSQSGGEPILFQYRMIRSGDSWKMYDVVTDGISMIVNFRSEFRRQIENGGLDSLIGNIRTHNQERAPDLTAADGVTGKER